MEQIRQESVNLLDSHHWMNFHSFLMSGLEKMSLVGFRLCLKSEYEEYEYHHRARIGLKPGITGMWLSGRSDITDSEEVVKLNTEYIRNWSMGLDFI